MHLDLDAPDPAEGVANRDGRMLATAHRLLVTIGTLALGAKRG